jgi:hypothetical protein
MPLPTPSPTTPPTPTPSLPPEQKAMYRKARIMAMRPEVYEALIRDLEEEKSVKSDALLAEMNAIRPRESTATVIGRGLKEGVKDLAIKAPLAIGAAFEMPYLLAGADPDTPALDTLRDLAVADQADQQVRSMTNRDPSTLVQAAGSAARSAPALVPGIGMAAGVSRVAGTAGGLLGRTLAKEAIQSGVAALPGGAISAAQSLGDDQAAGGYSPARLLLRAGLQGVLEVGTEMVPIFNRFGGEAKFVQTFLKRAQDRGVGSAALRAVTHAGAEMGAQSGQEALAGGAQSLADSLTDNEDQSLRMILREMAGEAGMGALSGGMMAGGMHAPSIAAGGVRDFAVNAGRLADTLGAQTPAAAMGDVQRVDRSALEDVLAGVPEAAPADQFIGDRRATISDPAEQTPAEREAVLSAASIPTPPTADGLDPANDEAPEPSQDPLLDFTPTEVGRFARADTSTPPTQEIGQAETTDIPSASTPGPKTGFDQYLADTGMTAEQHAKLSATKTDLAPWAPGDQKSVAVAPSRIAGRGIVATTDLPPGRGAVTAMDATGRRTPVGRFINHSDEPNAEVMLTPAGIDVVPVRPIAPGEELTINYRQAKQVQGELAKQLQAQPKPKAPVDINAGGAKTTGEIQAFNQAQDQAETPTGQRTTVGGMEPVTDTGTQAGTVETPTVGTQGTPTPVDAVREASNADRPVLQTPKGPRRVSVSVQRTEDGGARISGIKLHDDATGRYDEMYAPDNRFPDMESAETAGHRMAREHFQKPAMAKPKSKPATTPRPPALPSPVAATQPETKPVVSNGTAPDTTQAPPPTPAQEPGNVAPPGPSAGTAPVAAAGPSADTPKTATPPTLDDKLAEAKRKALEKFQAATVAGTKAAADKAQARQDMKAAVAKMKSFLKGNGPTPSNASPLFNAAWELVEASARAGIHSFREMIAAIQQDAAEAALNAEFQRALEASWDAVHEAVGAPYAPRGDVTAASVLGTPTEAAPTADEASTAASTAEDAATDAEALAKGFLEDFTAGKTFSTIVEARKRAGDILARDIKPGDLITKMVDEAVERAVVERARQLMAEGAPFEAFVNLYAAQPKLGTRTSTSVEQQAYSTPIPLARIASHLAGISLTAPTTVYEPTAGNGALLIGANPMHVVANELNDARATQLRAIMPGATITTRDATQGGPAKGSMGVVIANPPFGPLKGDDGINAQWKVGGYETSEIDHAIALKSLESMSDTGKSVLILGGLSKLAQSEAQRKDGYRGKSKRLFYRELYNQYNVVDHFTVAGELYERQGAGWPVDVIVIHGRGKSALTHPGAQPPRVYNTWGELQEKLNGTPTERPASRPEQQPATQGTGQAAAVPGQGGGVPDSSGGRPDIRNGRPAEPVRDAGGVGSNVGQPTQAQQPEAVRAGSDRPEQPEGPGTPAAQDPGEGAAVGSDPAVGTGDGGLPVDRPALTDEQRQKTGENAGQVAYRPMSGGRGLGTLVPAALKEPLERSLQRLAEKHGSVDAYVAKRLKMSPDQLSGALAAEQVDAVALAIDNMDSGKALILGDQTGIGKGRVVAAVMRYAMANGKMPIFVTEKPSLYKDMYRDMTDIGVQSMLGRDIRLFTTNVEEVPLSDDGTKKIAASTTAAKAKAMEAVRKNPKVVDALFTTYSQMQTVKGKDTERRKFIDDLSNGSIIVLDESHNAGGQKDSGWGDDESAPLTRAEFVRAIAEKAGGVMFSSATYAKNPDVMDLYARTDMRLAVAHIDNLSEAISTGGIPMQQIVAEMLAEAGQYVRRERSYNGVQYAVAPVAVDRNTYEAFSSSINKIFEFSRKYVKDAADQLDESLAESGDTTSDDNATGESGASSTSFTSIMHNVIGQMLLATKANYAVDQMVAAHQRGEKPVIALANTMGAILDDVVKDLGIRPGAIITADFRDVLQRYLYRSREIIEDIAGEKKRRPLTDEELGPAGVAAFAEAESFIRDAEGLGKLPLSPIDFIISSLKKAGIPVGEITGRRLGIDYTGERPVLYERNKADIDSAGKIATVEKFNDGRLGAIILNQSGSTGLSLHANEKFKDRKQRHMFIVQANPNIDTHMQMLGRIHRTGQVVLPKYSQIYAEVPAEQRPAAVLAKKMASLNANTTGSRSGALDSDAVDLLNEYGDQAAAAMLNEDGDLSYALGDPITAENTDGAARKVTGRIPLLPLAQQEKAYSQLTELYHRLVEEAKARGNYKLEARDLPLKAKTLEKMEAVAGNGDGGNPFTAPVYIEKVEADRMTRSMSPEDAMKEVQLYTQTEDAAWDVLQNQSLERARRDVTALNADWARFRQWMNDPANKVSEKERQRFTTAAQEYLDMRNRVAVTWPMMITMKDDKNAMSGMVIGIRYHKPVSSNAFPLQMSKTEIVFAPNNGIRRLVIPLSNIAEMSRSTMNRGEMLDAMRKGGAGSREQRFILTGNILSAYEYSRGTGQIARFTRDDGSVSPGVYMPATWDFRKASDASVTFRSANDALAFWNKHQDAIIVDAEHGTILHMRRARGTVLITVPKAKSTGGKYALNKDLRKVIGRDFITVGNQSRAEFDEKRSADVIRALHDIAPMKPHNHLDEMRPKEATKPADAEPMASIPDPTLEPTEQEIATILTPESAKRIAGPQATVTREPGRYRITGRGGVEVYVRLPKTRDEMQRARETGAAGFYDRATNSIVLVPSKATPFTLTHELVHLFKDTGLITPQEWDALVQAHASDPGTIAGKMASYADSSVPLTQEQAQEELVAEAMERAHQRMTQDPPGALGKIRRFFRALAIGLGLRRLDAADVEQRILGGDIFGRAPVSAGAETAAQDAGLAPDSPLRAFSLPADPTVRDPDVEQALNAAHGAATPTLANRAKAALEAAKRGVRHFEHLSTHAFAEGVAILKTWESEHANAGNLAARILESHVVGLKPAEMIAFERKLVFDDLLKDVTNGLYDGKPLPFQFKSVADLQAEAGRINAVVSANTKISEALARRAAFQAEHVRKLVDAGLLHPDVLNDPAYYHHMVLAHLNERIRGNADGSFTGREDLRQSVQAWQKARVGSAKDYNTSYVQSEYDYLVSSLRALSTAQTQAKLKDTYDISGDLKASAKAKNMAAMDALWIKQNTPADGIRSVSQAKAIADGWDSEYRQRIAMASDSIVKQLASGEYSQDVPFTDLVDAARNFVAERDAAKRTGASFDQQFDHPDFWKYLNWASRSGSDVAMTNDSGFVTTVPAGMSPGALFKAVAEREGYVKEQLKDQYRTWRMEAKDTEGYTNWQPVEGLRMALMHTPTSQAMDKALKDAGIEDPQDVDVLPISTKGMRKALVVVGAQPTWVIPTAIADQLDSMKSGGSEVAVAQSLEWLTQQWKAVILNNPLRLPAFFINNMAGDIDISLTHPGIWKHVPQATADMWNYVYGRPTVGPRETSLREAANLGLLDAGQVGSELPNLQRDDFARRIYGTRLAPSAIVSEVGRTLIGQGTAIQNLHRVREGVLRLAAYRYFLDKANPKQRRYGASSAVEVNALYDRWQAEPAKGAEMRKTIAAKLARELLGDYGNLSTNGQWMRRTLIPFWSWAEINAPRYARLIRNARYEGAAGSGATAAAVVGNGLKLATTGAMFYATVMAYNVAMKALLGIGDDDDPNKDKDLSRLILITGRDEDGTVTGVKAAGALADALGWLGLANLPSKLDDIADAERRGEAEQGYRKVAGDVLFAPVNRMVSGVTPLIKTPAEVATGKTLFPDVRAPRDIRDPGQAMANTVGYGAAYRWYADTADADSAIAESILKKRNPGASAWFEAKNAVYEYAKRVGASTGGGTASDKSDALFQARTALINGDRDRAKRWLRRYMQAGGDTQGLKQSIAKMNPITILPLAHRVPFMQSLSPKQRADFERGQRYWREHLAGGDDLRQLMVEARSTP